MLQSTIQISGQPVQVMANVAPAYNKNYVVLTVTGTFNNFTYIRHYNIRGGNVPPEAVQNFKQGMLEAYQGVMATVQFLQNAGFVEVAEPQQGE